jgi:thymidylate synthase (FAD)
MHNAKLIWITPNAEQLIGKIARVSNPKNEDNPDSTKLLKYLIKHKHWSPFEMASMCVEIHTTRAISPQILRHRSFSFQEFSQRYAIPTDTFATVLPDLRRQDDTNRQNSIDDLPSETLEYYQDKIDEHFRESVNLVRITASLRCS